MKLALFRRLENLALRVHPFFDLPIIGQPPLTSLIVPGTPPANFEMDGALPNLGSLFALFNAFTFGAPGVMANSNFQNSAAATITLTSLFGAYVKLTNGGAVTVTLDSAYNIVNALQYPFLGETFGFQIVTNASTTVATPTLTDTAVTLAGTTTVTTAGFRQYLANITQLFTTVGTPVTAGTTFTSIAQVGSTNAFTVTLATNALVPVVGNVIFINVTAGTLPSGWYPIIKVTSATSFVIATPAGTVWTATAATIPGTTVVPASQYTLGSPTTGPTGGVGVYSPLLTVTGMMGMAAGAMVV